jgi:aryl-alcohol dehydrogenase-like predicted oxidoreductase
MAEQPGLPTRPLGQTGVSATIFGLGGEGVLRTWGREREARALIERALQLGVNYFESARAYAGSESYYGATLGERRRDIFLTSKTAARTYDGALRDLDTTLQAMQTDYLDLWQFHDLRTQEEWQRAQQRDGALAALAKAKEEGRVRFIGLTGHHDPDLLARAMSEHDFDTVLLPVNVAEPHWQSFLDVAVPVAQRKGMGIIGMKVLCRGLLVNHGSGLAARQLIRYALSQPVSLVTVGCDNIQQLEENVAAARAFTPLSDAERAELLDRSRPHAAGAIYYRPI